MQHLGLVLVPGGRRPVRVDHEGPAEPVDHHLVVIVAQQDAAGEAGRAAVGLVPGVMHLASGGGLVAAAGPLAVPAAEPDRVPDPGRDRLAVPDVQRQAAPAQPGAQQPAPQEAGQPSGAGEQLDGLADDGLLEGFAGPAAAERGGYLRAAAIMAAAVRAVPGTRAVPGLLMLRNAVAEP